jgi:uncharacterized membrane protein
MLIKIRNILYADWKLYLAVFAYTLIFSALTILKNYTFLTSGLDLGVYNQALWTTLFEGKFFYGTADLPFNPSGGFAGSFFGTHFSPILFLLLPFYAIYPSVEILLVMQSAVLALGAMPLYWMARDKLGKKIALLVSILYLAYPAVHYVNVNDFHIEALTSTFFLFAVYYLEREEWAKFFMFTILAMSTIEFAPIVALFVGIYGLMLYLRREFKGQRSALRFMTLTILIAALWLILALKMKDFFNPVTNPIPFTWNHVLSDPASILHYTFEKLGSKVFYVVCFIGPLAFLPLLAPAPLVMALPWIGASFITNFYPYYGIYYQYSAFVIPFVFIALVKAVERLASNGFSPNNVKKLFTVVFLSTIIFGVYLPIAPETPWIYQLPVPNERTELLHDMLSLIPQNASVLTHTDIFPHVSSRSNAYLYIPTSLLNDTSIDYVLIDTNSIWANWTAPILPGDKISPVTFALKGLKDGEYGILASAKGIILLKKGYTGEPVMFVPYTAKYDYRVLGIVSGHVVKDSTSLSGRVMHHDAKDPEGFLTHGPYEMLSPGMYKVTYVINVGSNVDPKDHVLTVDVTASSGKILLAKGYVYGIDVPSYGRWFNVSLTYELNNITEGVEFRLFALGNYDTYLDYIEVEQLSPSPV